jgi:GMP synthase (glutamine-hydrolysing)
MLHLLIVEGNPGDILADNAARGLRQAWQSFAEAIALHMPGASFDVAFPHAPEREAAPKPVDCYDGFLQTGSGVSFTASDSQALPYLRRIEAMLATGKPVFGACWGIQTAAVALGGAAAINPAGTEIGLARDIVLTDAGREHALFAGMPERFSSPAWHRDHVSRLPEGAEILAGNAVSPVQAMAYARNGVDYMGVQFHPETPLPEMLAAHLAYAQFGPMPGTVREIVDFPDIAPQEVADARRRTMPIGNWLRHAVRRKAQAGGRSAA